MTGNRGYLRYPHAVADRLVFAAEDDVWTVPVAGGPASRLTADRVPVLRPRLSPDGQHVAWMATRSGATEAFVMPVEGGPARQLTWFGAARTSSLGFAPDGRLVVHSAAGQPFNSDRWAYAVDLAGGAPQRLPYGPISDIAWAGSGAILISTGQMRDYAQWKRYRGGTAGRLWLAPAEGADFVEFLPELIGQKGMPVAIAGRFAFLSDFEGHGNVYSVAADGTDLRRHTDHDEFWARQLTGDGSRLSYQCGGEIWLLDDLAPDSQAHRLDIALTGPRAGRAPFELEVGDHLGHYRVDQTGRASVIEIRGDVVWLTSKQGPARVLAAEPGVRHRLPVILPAAAGDSMAGDSMAGDSVAYVTGRDGDDALEIAAPDGTRLHFGAGRFGRVLELAASPDGCSLALATHDGRVLVLDVASQAETELERNPYGDCSGLTWSPDSAWLAYAAASPVDQISSIRLVRPATGQRAEVTGTRFADRSPAFSLDGKYLAFLSVRTFDPVYDAHVFDLAFTAGTRPYLVTLAADTRSPFDPELAGQPLVPAGNEPGKEPGKDATDGLPVVTVELDGIADRVVPFPVRAGRYAELRAVKDGFVWTEKPVTGELGESRQPEDDIRPSLQRWDLARRKQVELNPHHDAAEVSADGTRIILRDKDKLFLVPADRAPAEDAGDKVSIDLSRVRLSIDPAAEWAQMLDETGRLMRDHYWTPDLSGLDWAAVLDRYRPLIDRLGSRDDLSDLLWEVNGETGSSHAYEMPKPAKKNPLLEPAYLGADLTYLTGPAGGWRIERILHGDNSARAARSPLTGPGVRVRPGDEVISVNGRAIDARGPAPLLRGLAGKPVALGVRRDGADRTEVVTPLADELELRYLDWVASRRALVHQATEGRVGYLHVPDMMSAGWAAFHRDLHAEISRDAVIVDTRNNGGGHTSQLVVEKLARSVVGWDVRRHKTTISYPQDAPRGPLVSLANEWAGSDGDIVNAAIKSLRLGPVLGTRTWGGVVGIDGRYQLVDGTAVTQPRYAFWFEEFDWSVENYGVDPDVVVEKPPQAWRDGADPQLTAGIQYLLDELARRGPRRMPDIATRPDLAAPELPPRP